MTDQQQNPGRAAVKSLQGVEIEEEKGASDRRTRAVQNVDDQDPLNGGPLEEAEVLADA